MENDKLKKLLNGWKPEVQPPTDFQRRVWQSIAAREEESSVSWWGKLSLYVSQYLSQPQWAAASLAVVLILSGAVGLEQSRMSEASVMESRYVAFVDPYTKAKLTLIK